MHVKIDRSHPGVAIVEDYLDRTQGEGGYRDYQRAVRRILRELEALSAAKGLFPLRVVLEHNAQYAEVMRGGKTRRVPVSPPRKSKRRT